jgi:hypothetical protein
MTTWLSSFFSDGLVYWIIAVFASVLQVLLLFGALMGGHFEADHGDVGHDGSGDSDGAVKLFSLRVLVAFFVGFGWAGVLAHRHGMEAWLAALWAAGTGAVFMAVLFFTLRVLLSMRHDGTLNYRNAVGVDGQAYVTIPARRQGFGQVEILLQGRLITTNAVTDADEPVRPNQKIRVTAVEAANVLVVQPVTIQSDV